MVLYVWDTSRGGGVDGFSVLTNNVEAMNHGFLDEILMMAGLLAMWTWSQWTWSQWTFMSEMFQVDEVDREGVDGLVESDK